MRFKRCLFLTLILFLTIFSISFACASDNSTLDYEASEHTLLTSDDNLNTIQSDPLDVSDNDLLGQVNNEQEIDEIESENSINNNETQLLRSINNVGKENDVDILSAENDLSILGASNDVDILGADLYGGTLQDIADAIKELGENGGGVLYLHGGTYTGTSGHVDNTNINHVWVIGGNYLYDNTTFATLSVTSGWDVNPLVFSGTVVNDCRFTGLRGTGRLFSFDTQYDSNTHQFSGSLTDTIFEHCTSVDQFIFFTGSRGSAPNPQSDQVIEVDPNWEWQCYNVKNCHFWYCNQTYDGFEDGHGQFCAVLGANLDGCEFINTTSGQHSGAICVSDESYWGAGYFPSTITNCRFENITSKWFAVYIHGRYRNSPYSGILGYEVVENCSFINCFATEGYGAGLGISHDDLQVRNCTFINNVGGQGSAIMVGGISKDHGTIGDYAFNGDNTKGNNITIMDCTFKDCVATVYDCPWIDENGTEQPTTSNGFGGAVYIVGNNTKVLNCTFENNTGTDGSAMNIFGINTTVRDSKFYNNSGINGTVYVEGANTTISNSKFDYNNATNGAGAYVKGENATITNSEFNYNKALFNESSPETSGLGGALDVIGNDCTVINVTSNGNTAYRGGSTFVRGNDTKIINCTLDYNNATLRGGALNIAGNNCTVTNIDASNNMAGTMGGAMYIVSDGTKITNVTADNNIAQRGGAAFINGTHITVRTGELNNNKAIYNGTNNTGLGGGFDIVGDDCLVDNVHSNNNTAYRGGSTFIRGNNITVSNCNLDNNSAELRGGALNIAGENCTVVNISASRNKAGTDGGAVYVIGDNSKFDNVTSLNNTAERGGSSFIQGNNIVVTNCTLNYNNATLNGGALDVTGDNCTFTNLTASYNRAQFGGAAFVRGDDITFDNISSINNTAYNGGSSYVVGNNLKVYNGTFTNNTAIVAAGPTYGLGGAIYVDGNNTITNSNVFTHNKARNGSAIYTDGNNFRLNNDVFNENQAWSYLLIITPKPKESNYNASDVNVTIVHVGGDNIVNAIHNAASNENIHFYNVTYKNHKDSSVNTGLVVVEPVNGAEQSEGGTLLYQDDREYLQSIFAKVTHEDGEVIYPMAELITDIYGEVNITLRKPLRVGNYTVYAYHPEDWNYKFIENTETFRVYGYVDLSTNKTADKEEYLVGELVVWTINVSNAANGTNATNVTLKDLLPSNFQFINCTTANGTYNATEGIWYIGNMTNGSSARLIINSRAVAMGIVTNTVNVTSNEDDWNLTNNIDNETVIIIPPPVKTVSNSTPYYHDFVEYNLTVENMGDETFVDNLTLIDSLPEGLEFNETVRIVNADLVKQTINGQNITWILTNISAKSNATIIIRVKVNALGNLTNNLTVVGPKGTNATVNTTITPVPIVDLSTDKSADKEVYFVDDIATWTIVVNNAGNGTNATNVTLKDVLPSNFEYINSTTANGTYNATSGVWTIGFMGNGTSATLVITSRAIITGNNITNTANVTSNEKDWNLTNNVDNETVDIIPLPDPVKTVTNTTPYYHDTVEYNLTIVNTADTNYTNNLTVIDSLPIGLEFVSVVNVTGADIVSDLVKDGQKLTWIITNISAKSNATITLKVKVNVLGNLTNNLTIVGPNGTNKTVNQTVNPIPIVDLSTDKSADKEVYFVDDIATWTIVVNNAGNGTNATNVTLKDVLPSEFEFINCTTANGTYNATTGVWTIGFMGNGTSATLVITSRAKVVASNVTNEANVTSNEKDWNLTNNYDNETVDIVSIPKPVKTVSNTTPYYHDTVEYNLTIVNEGNDTYTDNLTVIDDLPVGLEFVSVVNVTGADIVSDLVRDGQKLTWVLTNISRKSNATITIRIKVNALGNLTNNLTVATANGTSLKVNQTITPIPLVDLSTDKSADKEVYFIDDIATWTIVVNNAGNGTNATNVTLKDVLPAEFEFINCTTENGTYNATTGVWTIGFMGNGTSATLVITSRAIAVANNIANTANVTSYEKDWNLTNNVDNETVDIIPLPEPVKTVSNSTPYYHEIVEYNLTIVNAGNVTYTNNLTVIDSLPYGLEFVSVVNVTGADIVTDLVKDGQKLTWIITNISAKSNATIIIKVKVNAVGNLTNNLTIVGPNGTNMTVNETVTPVPIVDLSTNKTADKEEYFVDDIATWTIVVNNAANGTNATNVTLKDVLPAEFEFINCTTANGTYNATSGVWTIGFMGNGTSAKLIITSRAKTVTSSVTNEANVTSTEKDWNLTNNYDNETVEIVPLPDPVKTVSNSTPYYHDIVEYNLTVINTGNTTYTNNLTVVDSLPVGLEFIEVVNITGAKLVVPMVQDGQKLTWILTNISAKLNTTIIVRVKVNALGNLTNNLTIVGPNGTNKTVNQTVVPVPIVDLSTNKTADKEVYFVDDIATWIIVVNNAGNGTNATNVTLKDVLPSEFEFINCTTANGTYNATTGVWTIGFMGNGTSAKLIITSRAKAVANNITNEANVTCTEKDWNLTNNYDNETVDIVPLPEPVKTVSNSTPYYHDIVEYNLTVVNTGNTNYTSNLTVVDSLPVGLEFVEEVNVTGADKVVAMVQDGQKLTWILTNISAKSNATIIVRVKVNALGNLTNNLTIVGPNGTNMTVNQTITPVPIVDVSTNKTADKEEYFVDDIAVWTIVVNNAGNGTNATNVTLKDVLPSQFEFINYTATNGTYNATTGIWTIGFMGNGTNATLIINSRAKVVVSNVTNTANVTSYEKDWNLTNNVDNETVEIVPLPDPVKTVSNSTPYYHDIVEYNLTVVNVGNYTYSDNLTVVDSLPVGLEFIEVVNITGAKLVVPMVQDGQKLTWILTNISAKLNATIIVRVKVNALGNLTNNLTIVGPNGTNKTVNVTITPVPIVDLSTNKTADKEEYFVDDIAVWTIVVNNAANGTNATNVTLKDVLPSEFEFISCATDNGTYNATTGVWSIGFMGNGTSAKLIITSRAKTVTSSVTNEANVTSTEKDWNLTNNYDNETVEIVPLPDPVKTVSNSTPYYHDIVEYNLTVVNVGNTTYTNNLTVVDSLPVGLEFIEVVNITGAKLVAPMVKDGQKLTWILTNISAKSNATIIVKVKVNALGNLTNNLTIIGPNGTNKTVNETVTPVPIVDLSTNKTADKEEYLVGDIVVWTITVSNAANGTNATNVTLKDVLPAQLEFINCTTANGTYNATTGVWTIGFMGNGTNATLVINSRAKIIGNVTNDANVTSNEKDWNLTNNFDNETVGIVPTPVKTVSNSTPYYHDVVEYNLTVENTGNVTYTDILTVIDSLPTGLEFIETVDIINAKIVKETQDGQKVTWTITNITAKSNATIIVKVKVNALGNLTNNLTVVGPKGTNSTVNCTITPEPIVDLSTDKTSDKDEYFVDDIATWTIVVNNAANGTNATNVTLKDILPSQFEFINYTTANGTYDNKTGIWTIGFMGNGTSAKLVINSRAKAVISNVTNVANVTCNEKDWNLTNNVDNKTVEIVPLPEPEKTVNNATPYNHEFVEYTLTIINTGNTTYTNELVVIDSLPDGLEFNKTLSIDGADLISETVDGQKITWIITNISGKSSAVIKVKVYVNAIGNLTNNLTVVGPNGTNITVNCTINPIPVADLEVIKENDYEIENKTCHNQTVVEWHIKVINNGPNDAVNVIARDFLPNGLVYVSDDSDGAYNHETGIWTIGELKAGDSVILTIVSRVNATNVTITNCVNVTSDTHDPDESNNEDNSSIVVEPEADLEVIKLVSHFSAHKGDKITWTIIVTNNGADTAVNTVVSDKLPSGLVYVSDDSKGTYNHNTGIWKVGDLACGESATLKIVTIVDTTNKTLVNFVNTTSDTYDPNETNNYGNNSTVIPPEVDLVLTIEPDKTLVTVGDKIVFTVTIVNQGPDTAVNTRAYITIPDALKLIGFKPSKGTYDPKTSIWTIGDLAPGEKVTLLLNTKALKSGTFMVKAYTVCDTYERDLTNNNDTAEVEVIEPDVPPVEHKVSVPPKMHATGNPIIMVLLALLAIVGVTLKRKN